MIPLSITILSACTGFFGSLLGVGGGAFLVPIMVLGLNIDPIKAMPISLMCALATGISGTMFSPITDNAIRRTLIFEPPALVGALLFSPVAYLVSAKYILMSFSFFIFTIALISISSKTKNLSHNKAFSDGKKNVFGIVSSFATGACSGLFGIGGGVIMVPLLRIFSGIALKEAVQISLSIMISTSVIGLLVHASLGEISFKIGLLGVAGAIPGGMLGARTRHKMWEGTLDKLFFVFAFAIAIATLIKAFTMGGG